MRDVRSFPYRLVVLLSLLVISFVSMNTGRAVDQDLGPFTTVLKKASLHPPESWNSTLPLSDQSNNSHWTLDPALSDEFRSGFIDSHKWLTYDPNTGGGFDRSLAIPTAQGMEFHMRKGPTQGSHIYRGSTLHSLNKVLYGYLEAEIKMPSNYANNNFFLYHKDTAPAQWTELDIAEVYPLPPGSANIVSMNAHVFYSPTISSHLEAQTLFRLDRQKFSDDYHVFGLAWTKRKLSWYLDGHLLREGVNSSWHQPLNISIGCWDTNRNDQLDPALVPLEAMRVKYIRVWKAQN